MVSIKADGTRVSLVFYRDMHNASKLFLIERGHRAIELGTASFNDELFAGTVLDCELCGNNLWIFDCYQVCGNSLYRKESYPRRMAIATELVHRWSSIVPRMQFGQTPKSTVSTRGTWKTPAIQVLDDRKSQYIACDLPTNDQTSLRVHVKPLFHVNQSVAVLEDHFPFDTDGLVYTPIRNDSMQCLKYKSEHTVDFLVGPSQYPDCLTLHQYNGLSKSHDAYASARIPPDKDIKNGSVWECVYQNEEWVFMRHRADKRKANESRTVADTMQCVHEDVQPHELVPRSR